MPKTSQKPVTVKLEKAEERIPEEMPRKVAVLQVAPEILEGLKSSSQIEEEQALDAIELARQVKYDYYKNKALFYVGVFAGVGILYLLFRYSKAKPEAKYVQEIVNVVAQ